MNASADQMGSAPMDVDAAWAIKKGGGKGYGGKTGGKGGGKGACWICGRPGHRAEACRFAKGGGGGRGGGKDPKGKGRGGQVVTKFEGDCRHCGKKGHRWTKCSSRLAGQPHVKETQKFSWVGRNYNYVVGYS